MKNKKTPLRKCLGCEERFPKKELIRIVKDKKGNIILDKTGKANGRGAYICNNSECLEKAYKNKKIEKTFRSQIPENIYEIIKEELNENE
ncbi:MAG: YlxR family protein [Eubacteriales bacterium]